MAHGALIPIIFIDAEMAEMLGCNVLSSTPFRGIKGKWRNRKQRSRHATRLFEHERKLMNVLSSRMKSIK